MSTSLRRVLHIVDDGSLAGGAQRLVLDLLLNNRVTGWEPYLASPVGELQERAEAAGVSTEIISFEKQFSLPTVRKLIAFARSNKIDVLHSHLPMSNIHAHVAALVTRAAHLGTLHAEGEVYSSTFIKFLSIARRMGFSPVSVSSSAAESVHRRIKGAPVAHVHNGIDTQAFATKITARQNDPAPIIGCIGRLHPHKGQDVLLRAFAVVLGEYASARLVIVGDGEDGERLERLARDLGIERSVSFHGYQSDVRTLLDSFTLCAVPSRQESFGLVVLEAGAMCRPVVATSVGGIPEVLGDEQNGLLVPANNPEKFAEALLKLLRDPSLAMRLAYSLHRRVQEQFSIERCAERYAEVYASLLKFKS